MRLSFSWLVFSLPILACASPHSQLQRCEPIAALPALPELACRADPQTREYRDRLTESMGSDVGPLFVRAMLDDSSRVRSLCMESTRVRRGWRAEQNLSRRLSEFTEVEAGPACLANRRLDLNRRAAKMAKIKQRRSACFGELGTISKGGKGRTAPQSGSMITGENWICTEAGADWVEVSPPGLRHPLIFAKPEVSNPPTVTANKIRKNCLRKRDYRGQVSCIMGYGWELLE